MPPKQKQETGELMVSIEQYTKTRDSVIVALSNLQGGLTHVQNGLNELLGAYMRHTTSILAGENGDLDQLQIPSTIAATASAAMEAATSAANGATQVINAANAAAATADGKGTKKRKREKKEKDPNAPKKPLTAAFLYHQHARPIVKADLEAALGPGEKVEKSAVQIEMNKRWHELPEEEKDQWKASYRKSQIEYQVQMAEYMARSGKTPTDVHEEEEGSDDGEAEVEVEGGAVDTEVSSEDEEEVPAAKAPSPPAKPGRKRQKTAPASAVNGTSAPVPIAPASTTTPVPLPGARAAPQAAEAPAKKVTKKNAKAAPQPIAPAPAASAQLEASPEEQGGKKKAKGGRTTRNAEAEVDKENTVAATPAKKTARDRSKRKSEASS